MDRGEQVELDSAVERLGALVAERGGGGTARVAEQHVEPAQLVVHPFHQGFGLGRDADVRRERCDALARLQRQLVGRAPDCVGVTPVDGHAGSLVRQGLRDGATQTLGAAAHQRDASRQTEVHAAGIYCARDSGLGARG